jgi:hypothetical protein
MTLSAQKFDGLRRFAARSFVALLVLCALGSRGYAQRNSGGAAITLSAVLSQSLTMSASQDAVPTDAISERLRDPAETPSSVTITTQWVRGSGNVSVAAFSPANPLLGPVGQAMIPVGTASPMTSSHMSQSGESFLSAEKKPVNGLPGLRINTKDLQIPAGSEGGILTIRAQAL